MLNQYISTLSNADVRTYTIDNNGGKFKHIYTIKYTANAKLDYLYRLKRTIHNRQSLSSKAFLSSSILFYLHRLTYLLRSLYVRTHKVSTDTNNWRAESTDIYKTRSDSYKQPNIYNNKYNGTFQNSNISNRIVFPRIISNKEIQKLNSKTFILCTFGKRARNYIPVRAIHTSNPSKQPDSLAVSYTHLTLPTNREV